MPWMSSAIDERGLSVEYGDFSSPHAANANNATMAIGPSVARRRVNDFRPLDGPRRSILPPRTEILLPLSNRTRPVFDQTGNTRLSNKGTGHSSRWPIGVHPRRRWTHPERTRRRRDQAGRADFE